MLVIQTVPHPTGSGPGYFLCGCSVKLRENYAKRGVRYEDGMLVCPEHGEPEYGFATPTVTGPQGNQVPDWSAMGSYKKLDLPRNSETESRRAELLGLDKQAKEILKARKAGKNGR